MVDLSVRPLYLTCSACGYGARVLTAVPACPMCRATAWVVDTRKYGEKELRMPWNDEMREDIEEELTWDPKVDAKSIAVSVDDGHVTLSGTVGSAGEKREAKKVAEGVFGVVAVNDELQVDA
jgi:osmotically-inducible protein OsmY